MRFPPTRGAAFCGRAAFDLVTALLGFEGAAAAFFWALAAFVFSLAALLDGLIALCLADLGFLVPLGQNLGQGSSDNGTLELLGLTCLLLGLFLFLSLLVLTSVKDGPGGVTRIPLHQMG